MSNAKISIIMPTYNTPEPFFCAAVRSILNQSYKNLELIVVDDGSATDIKNIVNKFNDNRIVYVNRGHNGAGVARNIGIDISTGDYIYVMASDDTLDSNAFKECIDLMEKYNTDIVLFNLNGQNNDGKITLFEHPVPFGITNPGDTTQLCKKSLITQNNIKYENFTSCNDLTFTYTILACAKRVVKINKTFYYYNQSVPNQISSNRGKKILNVILAFDALKQNLEQKNLFKTYKRMFIDSFVGCVDYELSFVSDDKSRQDFLNVLKGKYFPVYRRICAYKYSLIGKQRFPDGRRTIYFCGLKLFSYTKSFNISPHVFDLEIKKRKAYPSVKNSIQNIVLGSSTACDGFVPTYPTDFNMGGSSQDLYRIYNLYKWCLEQHTDNIQNVIIFFDVFSPGLQLEQTKEAHKCIIYNLLYNIPYAFELNKKYNKFIRLVNRYIKKNKLVIGPNYCGESEYNTHDDSINVAELVAKHLKSCFRNNNQIQYLDKIYNLTQQHHHNLCIVLPPYRADYTNNLPDKDMWLQELRKFIYGKNIVLLDFVQKGLFQEADFSDCHHLNKNGAEKLTMHIKQELNKFTAF